MTTATPSAFSTTTEQPGEARPLIDFNTEDITAEGNLPWLILGVALLMVICLLCSILCCIRRMRSEVYALEARRAKVQLPTAAAAVAAEPYLQMEPEKPAVVDAVRAPPAEIPSDWPASQTPISPDIESRSPWTPRPQDNDSLEIIICHPLKMTIVGAKGLRDSQGSPDGGVSGLFCACEVDGKPHTTFQTGVVGASAEPVWMHEEQLNDLQEGDRLSLSLWDSSASSMCLVGRADLLSDHILTQGANEFERWFPLSSGAYSGASLQVKITMGSRGTAETPFFSAWWTTRHASTKQLVFGEGALRNDFSGDVGFRFIARTAFVISALGRRSPSPRLVERVTVTLWSSESEAPLRVTTVGPESTVDSGYAYGTLREEVLLQEGKEYRISQQCCSGMADLWFDGAIPPHELPKFSAARFAEFRGSVYRSGFGFPGTIDDDERFPTFCRRAGMLNFKMLGQDPPRAAQAFSDGRLQRRLPPDESAVGLLQSSDAQEDDHDDLAQIRLICMSPPPIVQNLNAPEKMAFTPMPL